ncbi:hypothetical protein BWK58_14195, partial [Flavobacterium columnare]
FILTKKKLTLSDINDFEKELGMTLPNGYKFHLLIYNGGCPESKDTFEGRSIAHFYPIKYGNHNLIETYNNLKNLLPINFLNFAYDAGGNPFCFDLSEGKDYGKIYFCPMDMGEVIPEFLADSFENFMNNLEEF